jgi:hypothetical protein
MSDYHITAKGEEFVDEFQSHWQGAGDPAIAATFLWWMREDGNFQQHFKEVVERSSEQKALQMVEWAVNKEYLTQTDELRKQYQTNTPDEHFAHIRNLSGAYSFGDDDQEEERLLSERMKAYIENKRDEGYI